MTSAEFHERYQILQQVGRGNVRSFHALAATGAVVMVHYVDGPAESRDWVRSAIDGLRPTDRKRVVEIANVDDSPVIVTRFILDFTSLEAWLHEHRADPDAAVPPAAAPRDPTPAGEPSEFTLMFGKPMGAPPDSPLADTPTPASGQGRPIDPPAVDAPPDYGRPDSTPEHPLSAPPAKEPGEFTRMFRAQHGEPAGAPDQPPAEKPYRPAPPPSPPLPPPNQPGEFTRLFRPMTGGEAESASSDVSGDATGRTRDGEVSGPVGPPGHVAGSSVPDDFARIFRPGPALDPPPLPSSKQSSPDPESSPPKREPPRAAPPPPGGSAPPVRPSTGGSGTPGDFTSVFRSPASGPRTPGPGSAGPDVPSEAGPSYGSPAESYLDRLNSPVEPGGHGGHDSGDAGPAKPSEPGEFTRMLKSSDYQVDPIAGGQAGDSGGSREPAPGPSGGGAAAGSGEGKAPPGSVNLPPAGPGGPAMPRLPDPSLHSPRAPQPPQPGLPRSPQLPHVPQQPRLQVPGVPQAAQPPHAPHVPQAPHPGSPSGQSEFTRVISSAQMRAESQHAEAHAPVPPAAQPQAVPPTAAQPDAPASPDKGHQKLLIAGIIVVILIAIALILFFALGGPSAPGVEEATG